MSYKITKLKITDLYNVKYSNVNENVYYDEELKDYVAFPNIKRSNKTMKYNDIPASISVVETTQHRPDNIAYFFMPSQTLYWFVLQHNNIIDPFRLRITQELEIPKWQT
jgi:hypothetical protein